MHIGTKVGELSWSHRQRVSPGLEIETTYSGDIIQEHKITQQAKDEVEANFKKFTEKYGMSAPGTEGNKKRGRKTKDEASELLSKYQDQLLKAIGSKPITLTLDAPSRRQEV